MIDRVVRSPRLSLAFVLLFAIACYIPFINKAMHIDADMLVHTSRQFLTNPVNPPLGEYGRLMALHDTTKMPRSSVFHRTGHPPFLPLLLAPVVAVSGDREWPLHAVLFMFYIMSVIAVWAMLGLFYGGGYRLFGTLLWTASPALMVNGGNIMWDVAITGLMTGSLVLYLTALRSGRISFYAWSGIIAGIAALTKVNALPLFIICPIHLLLTRRWKELLLWCAPAAALPMVWVVHNLIVFGRIQYLSVGWFTFLIGDIRYRIERDLSLFGGALMLPIFWAWLCIARKRFTGLAVTFGCCAAWGTVLVAVLHKPVWFGISYAVFAAAGLWMLWRLVVFIRGGKSGDFRRDEPTIIAAYAILYIAVLNIMPSASMRYILPLVPLGLLVIGEELALLPATHRRVFMAVSLATGVTFATLLSVGDYLQCDADRRLPGALKERGYPPAHTWYFGRLSYGWYLFHTGCRNLRADTAGPQPGDFLVEQVLPGDYHAGGFLQNTFALTAPDTLQFHPWPVRTMGLNAGFYGTDRLPYTVAFGAYQKEFVVYRLQSR